MAEIYNYFYQPGIPLKWMGILVGLWLLVSHGFALYKPSVTADFLKRFPRNDNFGIVLAIIAFVWTFIVWSSMDLGEFYKVKRLVQGLLIIGCVGVVTFVKEYISVRSTGFLLILVAAPILISAFLQEHSSRLLLVALAYIGAVIGMFWVGIPYLLRDQIDWLLKEPKRLKYGAIGGIVYGGLVLICALAIWK